MAKKRKKTQRGHSKRLDPAEFGIDMEAILDQIRPHLEGMTQAEIGDAAKLKPMVVSHLMTGHRTPSLGSLASLANASGGKLVVKYQPPRK